jgi:hypothetical protein
VKRDSTLNYHSLADNRDDFGKVCGSTSNKEVQFSIDTNQQCPFNSLDIN